MRRARWQVPAALLLGALTTIIIAWTLALLPGPVTNTDAYTTVDLFGTRDARDLYITIEHRRGTSLYILATSERRAADSIGPAWEPFPGPIQGTPIWSLQPADRPSIDDAIHSYPSPRGFPQPQRTAKTPSCEPWPAWLPDLPNTALLAYGGRAAGWPFMTMRSMLRVDPQTRTTTWSGAWRLRPAIDFQRSYFSQDPQSGTVPLFPDPLRFPLSTAMWATLWWAAIAAPTQVRRHLRRRKNLCPHCAYNRAGLPPAAPCPECGRR